MSVESPKVFERGPLADAATGYAKAALDMMNNGSFYDTLPPLDEPIGINPYGRGIECVDFSEPTVASDGMKETSAVTWVDWIEVSPVGLHNETAAGVAFDTTELFDTGGAVQAELLAVDIEDFTVTLREVLLMAMSTAYMAGRADQIADMLGTNQKRFVRHRDLSLLIQNASDPLVANVFSSFTEDSKTVIDQLKGLIAVLHYRKDELRVDYKRETEPYVMPDFVQPLRVLFNDPDTNENS